jgi:hypothetical protein
VAVGGQAKEGEADEKRSDNESQVESRHIMTFALIRGGLIRHSESILTRRRMARYLSQRSIPFIVRSGASVAASASAGGGSQSDCFARDIGGWMEIARSQLWVSDQ